MQAPETLKEENFLSEQRSCGPKAVVVRSDSRSMIRERKKKSLHYTLLNWKYLLYERDLRNWKVSYRWGKYIYKSHIWQRTYLCLACVVWRRQWHPSSVLLPGKSRVWRSLVGCSPWGHTESDTTERLPFHFSLSCTGEGNDNPLQCSCLENPRDGEAG